MPIRFPDVPDLTDCLWRLVAQTPRGRVTTCGDLAVALGNHVAARWIGHLMLHHPHTDDCLCHRVVRAEGKLGGYVTGEGREKIVKLEAEGVEVQAETVSLDRFGFRDFQTDRPLARLAEEQENIRQQIEVRPRRRMPKLVGGLDVAYPKTGEGQAAYALVDTSSGELLWGKTIRRPVVFPYITSYLSFREIPLYLELLDEVRKAGRLADVVMVDGTGILHPRCSGIASHLGVVAGVPTVGLTKKLLCGKTSTERLTPGEMRPVVLDGRVVGTAMQPPRGQTIFVSPGHGVDVAFCKSLVGRLWFGRRLPSPVYWADRLSRNSDLAR